MHSATLNRRKLWTMTCETLFQNFTASLTPEMIIKLCRRHRIPLPGANRGKVALFQLAHERCHHDTSFARQVQRHLNQKHTAIMAQFALLPPEEIRSTVESILLGCQTTLPDALPGILWAVCSDPREAARPIEKLLIDELHLLSHCLLLAQFQGYVQMTDQDKQPADTEREALQQELAQLKTEQCDLRRDMRQLQGVNTRLVQDKSRLQRQLNTLKQRSEVMNQQRLSPETAKAPESVTPRELKKLRYDLTKLTESLREKEDETQRLMAIVASYEEQTPDHSGDVTEGSNPPQLDPELPSLDLNGKTVALIGGLVKASVHYEQVILQLGGSCIHHDGTVNQGHKRLAKVIRQADVVFCPVDCVSHGTASSAKRLCRTFDKPCYFLRSSGVSHIREKLREVALQA